MLNTTLRNGLMLLIWLCLIFSVRAEEVPFLAPQQRPQLEANQPWPADRFLVLAYHDVEDDAADQRYLSVRTSALNEQIAWLLHNGYHAISVQDILDAHYGLKSLPPKAFLLSFDDGYSSFYTRVWPLLKAWNVPALWAPVGSWVDTPAGQPVNFGGLMTPRERFATWEMVRELSRSPLVETRGNVKVYAWMPVLAFDLDSDLPRVQRWDQQTGKALLARQPYVRLSPWDPRVRQQITDIYEDLARHASFSGILFHDDAVLTDFEDVSPEAVAAWRQTGMAHDADPVPQRPQERQAWMRFKSQTLTRFTLDLRQAVQAIRGPQVKTARNLFALPILEPQSEAWFAQNLDDFLAAYDWTVPMAMPLMESVPIDASQAWLTRLVQAVARHPGALKKTIFELQARDWNRRQQNAIPDQQLADWMRLLRLNGVKNYGYYPDDFINNQPDISRIRPQFSSWWYPDHD
ncbi:TPA: poly-beta-1,6-N-acetyl-D-glucosamine N-deacetylase PgaB [Klebsiella pneumoniae]